MKWQDCFELIPSEGRGGRTTMGGDPDMYNRNPKLYDVRNIATGEVYKTLAMPKHTAEFHAELLFERLVDAVEMSILT